MHVSWCMGDAIAMSMGLSHARMVGEGIVELVYAFDANGVEWALLNLVGFVTMRNEALHCWVSGQEHRK